MPRTFGVQEIDAAIVCHLMYYHAFLSTFVYSLFIGVKGALERFTKKLSRTSSIGPGALVRSGSRVRQLHQEGLIGPKGIGRAKQILIRSLGAVTGNWMRLRRELQYKRLQDMSTIT